MDQEKRDTGKKERKPKKMAWVIPSNCEGCGECINHCPPEGLVLLETNVDGVYVPWLLDPMQCIGCGKCAENCIMGGIVVTEYVDMAVERFFTMKPKLFKGG